MHFVDIFFWVVALKIWAFFTYFNLVLMGEGLYRLITDKYVKNCPYLKIDQLGLFNNPSKLRLMYMLKHFKRQSSFRDIFYSSVINVTSQDIFPSFEIQKVHWEYTVYFRFTIIARNWSYIWLGLQKTPSRSLIWTQPMSM